MTIDPTDAQRDALLKRLHLANARRAWRDLVQRAEREAWSYHDFLALLVAEEIAQRQQTRIARMVRRAHFPFFKTIDDFNFSMQSTVRLALLGSALAGGFRDGWSLSDLWRKIRTGENPPRGRDRVPRDSEWLRCAMCDGRRTSIPEPPRSGANRRLRPAAEAPDATCPSFAGRALGWPRRPGL
jgi:hypothetical protein